jgi:thiol:disulfide interchange protein|uniref:LiaF transmembrane domain-containing protein n=1 Tax=candidate division WOR-3 bacterium TaxID=2052148 RepID=A0A7C4Y6E5_UNCW3
MVWGILFILFGVVIWVLNFLGSGWNWGRDWPFLLILWGIYIFTKGLPRKRKKKDVKVILNEIASGKISAEEGLRKLED